MKGDYSRITFDPKNHYSGVRMQQGRVQTDSDFNEQLDLTQYRIETEIKDFIGQSGMPESSPGFGITVENSKMFIGEGRCYAEGMLIENDAKIEVTDQADLPDFVMPTSTGTYLAYLDIWQRHITSLEASDIRDAALGSQDTATRLKNIWQVKLLRLGDAEMAITEDKLESFIPGRGWSPYKENKQENSPPLSTGKMCTRVLGSGSNLGNRLYRIEIHRPGAMDNATFKWSRENGSAAAEVLSVNEDKIKIEFIGRGIEDGLCAGDYIEITNDLLEINFEPGVIIKIGAVNADQVTLLLDSLGQDELKIWHQKIAGASDIRKVHTKAIKWDSKGQLPVSDLWTAIEDDIQVKFSLSEDKENPQTYNSGDYWLIPSRSITKKIYWPKNSAGEPLFAYPAGIRHYYSCLALFIHSAGTWTKIKDLRVIFNGLIEKKVEEELEKKKEDLSEEILTISDRIGIGTKTPEFDLDVNGVINAETVFGRTIRAANLTVDGYSIKELIMTVKKLTERINKIEEKL